MSGVAHHPALMARYNRWQNEQIYAASARLDDALRRRDLGAFFGSIHATLNHVLLADRIWLGRFTGRPCAYDSLRDELYGDFAELTAARRAEDERLLAWADGLESEWLDGTLEFESRIDGRRRRLPRWAAVSHLFNHQTHHRGQVTTLLYQQGIDPGGTDIPFMPDFVLA